MIERYTHEKHKAILDKWLLTYGIPAIEDEFMFDHGYCVDNQAIAFLVETNGKIAFIDHLAADPELKPHQRDEVVTAVLRKIEEVAKEKGYWMLQILTSLPSMKLRVERLGYNHFGAYSLHYKTLQGDR